MTEEIKLLRKGIRMQTFAVTLQALTALFIAYLLVDRIDSGRARNTPASITQEANPIITTNVQAPDQLSTIKERGEKRGFYYRSEFAELMGVSERTVDRWRESGRLETFQDEDGRIVIPLEAEVKD